MMWRIASHAPGDKRVEVEGPVTFFVDYDDVDHDLVDRLLPRMVDALNRHALDDEEDDE